MFFNKVAVSEGAAGSPPFEHDSIVLSGVLTSYLHSEFVSGQAWCDSPIFGALAQLGEHLLCKQGVVGSIPTGSTIWQQDIGSVAQVVRAHP